jgi:hypothetical protein
MKNLFFLLLFVPFCTQAQVPEPHMLSLKGIGGNGSDQVSYFVSKTPDGGFIMALGSNSTSGPIVDSFCSTPASSRIVFIKYNGDATTKEWSKCYTNNWSDTGYGFMFQTTDNKYIIGGAANSGNKWVIRKEDASGNILWVKAYGGTGSQQLKSILATEDGGYIFFGSAYGGDGDIGFHHGSASTRDFWVLKVDINGNIEWSKVYGGTGDDIGASVVTAPSGGCYIIGSTSSSDFDCVGNHGGTDAFVARLNKDGNIIWKRCLGGSGNDGGGEGGGCSAVSDDNDGILVATISGSENGDVSHQINPTGSNIWVFNIDSSNNKMWDNCFGGGGAEFPNAICKSTDSDIWITGCSRVAGGQINQAYGDMDAVVFHINHTGSFINAKVLGSSRQDRGYMIYPLTSGSIITGGFFCENDGAFSGYSINGTFPKIDAYLAVFTNWANEIQTFSYGDNVSVYPNPAFDLVNVHVNNNNKYAVIVNDITGKMVYNNSIETFLQIPLSGWHSGMYLMQIVDQDGNRSVKKLIVH